MLDTLRDWIYALMVCSAVGCICAAAAPSEEYRKYIKLAVSAVAALLVMAPLTGLIGSGDIAGGVLAPDINLEAQYAANLSMDWVREQSRAQIADGISGAIYKKTGILPEEVNINIEQDEKFGGALCVSEVGLVLPAEGRVRADEIKYYTEYLVACPVKVKVHRD